MWWVWPQDYIKTQYQYFLLDAGSKKVRLLCIQNCFHIKLGSQWLISLLICVLAANSRIIVPIKKRYPELCFSGSALHTMIHCVYQPIGCHKVTTPTYLHYLFLSPQKIWRFQGGNHVHLPKLFGKSEIWFSILNALQLWKDVILQNYDSNSFG